MKQHLDVCIVTSEIPGLPSLGDAGQAYYALGRSLVDAGHAVTVLYAPAKATSRKKFAHHQHQYSKSGMTLIQLPSDSNIEIRGSSAAKISYGIYRWLKQKQFDLVHFQERRGIAFYSLLGKHQGLCLEGAKTCVGVHHPTLWSMELHGFSSGGSDSIECDFMERESAALADSVWIGSRNILEWMKVHQWQARLEDGERLRPSITSKVRIKGDRAAKLSPLVSVCLIHHDRPQFLTQALASLRAQTYSKIEVVLVDDGSQTPEAKHLLRSLDPEFQQREWKLIPQSNQYLGAARNAAARAARGKYLLFMDEDNIAKPEEVEVFIRAMQTSKADILTCFMDVFRGDSYPSEEAQILHRLTFLGGAPLIGLMRNCFGDANCMIRKDVFNSLHGFTEDAHICGEDWELFAKGVLAGYRLEVVPEALVWYRQSLNGMLLSTPPRSNRLRALRPYSRMLPPDFHILAPMMNRLDGECLQGDVGESRHSRDQVKRVVIFGCGAAGVLSMNLARRCGWKVARLVDNNMETWGSRIAGIPVKSPATLKARDFDLVIVSSRSGKEEIYRQLRTMGFLYGEDFMHYLDPAVIGNTEIRLREA
jgi:glycosyltransferase involved in cell wall biosynthesis